MEEFLKKYGFLSEAQFFEHIKGDSVFGIKVVSDLLAEKFPDEFPKKAHVEEVVEEHPAVVEDSVAEQSQDQQ